MCVCAGTHVVEHGRPALHGDALEDSEHGKQDVVELGDAVVGTDPAAVAVVFVRAPPHAARKLRLGRVHRLVV